MERGRIIKDHWNHFNDPVAIGLDASRFDQHVSTEALEWEHSIYKLFFPHDKFFHKLLSWQTKNHGYGYTNDGNLKFKIDGCRMSGDMNTALGNCLLMSSMLHSFCKHVGVSRFRAVNDGDDCVLFMERKELWRLENLSQFFLEYGFNLKIEDPVYTLEKVEFCQARPIMLDRERCVMVRDVNVCFAKDSISIKPLPSPKVAKQWSRAIGLCGLSLTAGIPIAQEFYQAHIRSSEGAKAMKGDPTQDTGMARMAKGMEHRKYQNVTQYARYSFWKAFGIAPAKQHAIEQRLKTNDIDYSISSLNNLNLQ